MAAQLFVAFDTFRQTAGYERNATMNFWLLGAASFHLFTTFPYEPRWIAGRRWLRRRASTALAALAAPLVWLEGPGSASRSSRCEQLGFALVSGVTLVSLAGLAASACAGAATSTRRVPT
jgi:hypothetical protein